MRMPCPYSQAAMKNYKFLAPPKPMDSVQQGGTMVFKGHDMVYLHRDEATADHAPWPDVLQAAGMEAAAA